MRKRKSTKKRISYILRRFGNKSRLAVQRLRQKFIRTFLGTLTSRRRRPGLAKAGFVLPTVTMVMLVVILLTIAISLRSFDRAQDARNVRVNQAVLSAATPALDRARAKLEELLVTSPPTTGTPGEDVLYFDLTETTQDKFTFPDEKRLKVSYDFNDTSGIQDGTDTSSIDDDEQITTAWRFEVDTDNDGEPDSYTIYGIFFRTPKSARARSPLDARTPPMPPSLLSSSAECAGALGTSSGLVGDLGWYDSGTKLKKSFFTYAVTIPKEGTTGVSALEYQQDWSRIPLVNNAVVYEDDLEIAPSPEFHLNGRIYTNSNLIIAPTGANSINLHLVSDPDSCFYEDEENSKIIVGGNLVYGLVERSNPGTGDVKIDLMNGASGNPSSKTLDRSNDSIDSINNTDYSTTGLEAQGASYNAEAYSERLNALVTEVESDLDDSTLALTDLPQEVQDKISDGEDRGDALTTYFKKLIRKVPNAETACLEINDSTDISDCIGSAYDGTEDEFRPDDDRQDILVLPGETSTTDSAPTNVELNLKMLWATDPDEREESKQYQLGDRIDVGNNLPQKFWDGGTFTTTQTFDDVQWLAPGANADTDTSGAARVRTSQVDTIADIGSTDPDGFWEKAAAEAPEAATDGVGGLRVITGAGIYVTSAGTYPRSDSFLPTPPEPPNMPAGYEVVWPDTMPMSPPDGSSGKGDLQMRATVLYHYAHDSGENPKDSNSWSLEPQEPIACVSSYYDPSSSTADASNSNNGVLYPKPGSASYGSSYSIDGTKRAELDRQAKLVYPDGRLVNEPLKVALEHYDNPTNPDAPFTLADQAAIDAELCALDILDGDITAGNGIISTTNVDADDLPMIKEVSFLDGRQVKAIDVDDTDTDIDETFTANALIEESAGTYIQGYLTLTDDSSTVDKDESEAQFSGEQRLPLEERQPLEIRVTQLNLDALRKATIAVPTGFAGPSEDGNEYLLPMSGIIYATRNDALPDRSDPNSTYDNLRNSPYDLKLDPSRRPNGFMLVDGSKLARKNDTKSYDTLEKVVQEKGLIFVSNNPVYIQGDFNLHEFEEFTEELDSLGWDYFYNRSTLENSFACRNGDPRPQVNCDEGGDPWRGATVLADSVTLLSDSWRAGYRNEGDFDLRNNAGNGAVMATQGGTELTAQDVRKNNGFFANNYVTNGLSSEATFKDGSDTYNLADSNYRTKSGFLNSSYFNNFVTPVQRRVNGPEYVMEVCQKLPVSACEPQDWKILIDDTAGATAGTVQETTIYDLFEAKNYFLNGVIDPSIDYDDASKEVDFNIVNTGLDIENDLISGTTAKITDAVQRFPRRVAFLRNEDGSLAMDDAAGNDTPIAIGVKDDDTIRAYPYTDQSTLSAGTDVPRLVDNALWFRTTTSDEGKPYDEDEITYESQKFLFYLAAGAGGTKLKLAPTPTINGVSLTDDTGNDDPYRYAFCIADDDGVSETDYYAVKDYGDPADDITLEAGSGCPEAPRNKIQLFRQALMDLTADNSSWNGEDSPITSADDTNDDGVVVYELADSNIASGTTLTLEGDSNSVFVIRTSSSAMTFGAEGSDGVTLELSGVSPNNVFWVSNAGMTFYKATGSAPHLLAGNFIGKYDGSNQKLDIRDYTKILGARFLGFKGGTGGGGLGGSVPNGVDIRAMTSQGNPSLVPVLQIHEPDAATAADEDVENTNQNGAAKTTAWMVPATETTFNLTVGSGDVPSTPGQSNGGLQNLARFQENWQYPAPQRAVNISGSFIQLERSKYATAPQQQIIKADVGNDGDDFDADDFEDWLFGYPHKYQSGAANGILGFQSPPERNWGYDVGFLSQSPDLFAQKFTLPSSDNKPDEYFREVSRDDPWIKGLLCAVKEEDNTPVSSDFYNSNLCDGYK